MDDADFGEAFLQANARPDFIASQFADVIRSLMRAVSADGASDAVYRASEKMKFVTDLLQRCSERVTWHGMFTGAVEEIQSAIPEDDDDRRYVRAAKRGTKYLVELSCTDPAASGRASKRQNEFRDTIRWIEESRSGRR